MEEKINIFDVAYQVSKKLSETYDLDNTERFSMYLKVLNSIEKENDMEVTSFSQVDIDSTHVEFDKICKKEMGLKLNFIPL